MLNGRHNASTVQRSRLVELRMESQAIVAEIAKLSQKLLAVDRQSCEILERLDLAKAA
ncbi:MAG: hypothetical protein M0T85_01860 [Dehalococcoidales bacterium]|nr:hypothetical protein [Dehalococcoidales bacterium]